MSMRKFFVKEHTIKIISGQALQASRHAAERYKVNIDIRAPNVTSRFLKKSKEGISAINRHFLFGDLGCRGYLERFKHNFDLF